jgi:ABC-2 type transport system ATP-binding protein
VGLDAAARTAITAHVHDLASEGLAVLWATHLTDEVGAEDDLLVLHRGRLLARGPVADVTGGGELSGYFLDVTGRAA